MNWMFEKEFRLAHPETVGETDKEFDLDNYKDYLEAKLTEALQLMSAYEPSTESEVCPLCKINPPIEGYTFCLSCMEASVKYANRNYS